MPGPAQVPNLRWTKLSRPRIAGDIVRRARARERLDHNLDRLLILVCAPTGYGKTTLLSGWPAESGHPHFAQRSCHSWTSH